MPQITPYDPTNIKNMVVGVADYRKAKAGEAFENLARGLGQVRNQVAANAEQRIAMNANLGGQAISAIGSVAHLIKQNLAATNATQKGIASNNANNIVNSVKQSWNAAVDDLQTDPAFSNNTGAMPTFLSGLIDSNADAPDGQGKMLVNEFGTPADMNSAKAAMEADPYIAKHPEIKSAAINELQNHKTTVLERANNWAMHAGVANAHLSNVNTGDRGKSVIVNKMSGANVEPNDALALAAQTMKETAQQINGNLGNMGRDLTDKDRQTALQGISYTYFLGAAQNVANNPDGKKAFADLKQYKDQFARRDMMEMGGLTESQLETIDKRFDAAEDLQNTRVLNEDRKAAATDQVTLHGYAERIDAAGQAETRSVQINAQQDMKAFIGGMNDQITTFRSIENQYPPKLQAQIMALLVSRIDAARAVEKTAHDNLKEIDSTERQRQSDIKREVNENRRSAEHLAVESRRAVSEARQAKTAADKEAREAKKDKISTAQQNINIKREQLAKYKLQAAVPGMTQKITDLSHEIVDDVDAYRKNGFSEEGDAWAHAASDEAITGMGSAGAYQEQHNFFGGTSQKYLSPTNKKTAEARAQSNAKAINALSRQGQATQIKLKQEQLSEDPKYNFDAATRKDFRDTAHSVIKQWLAAPSSPQADANRDYQLGQIPAMLAKRNAMTMRGREMTSAELRKSITGSVRGTAAPER